MKNYFIPEMSSLINSGRKISHAKFSAMLEDMLLDDKKRQKLKLPSDVCIPQLDLSRYGRMVLPANHTEWWKI